MIQVERLPEPAVLRAKAHVWCQRLLAARAKHARLHQTTQALAQEGAKLFAELCAAYRTALETAGEISRTE